MDQKRLAQIHKRATLAEHGPWAVDTDEDGECWIRIPHGHDLNFGDMETTDACCFALAEFIAHSRDDIPWLLDQIQVLEEENRRLKEIEPECPHGYDDWYNCPICGHPGSRR